MLTGERNESVIVNGLSVIQTLLEFKKQGYVPSCVRYLVLWDILIHNMKKKNGKRKFVYKKNTSWFVSEKRIVKGC